MASGWIKKHRAWDEHPAMKSALRAGVWDKLTLRMARAPCRTPMCGGIDLEAGQLALVVSDAAREWGLTHKQLRKALETFREYRVLRWEPIRGKAGILITIENSIAFLGHGEVAGQSRGQSQGQERGKAGAKQGQTYKRRESGEGEKVPIPSEATPPSESGGRPPTAAPPPKGEVVELSRLANPALAIFSDGRRFLEATGMSEDAARSLLGKWKRDFEPWEVLGVLCQAFELGVEHPRSWVEDRLYGRSNNRQRNRQGGDDTRQRREAIARAVEEMEAERAGRAAGPFRGVG